jgi:hypothetical protein
MSMSASPEPWLRGELPGVDPLLAPALRSFEQVRGDLAVHCAGLSTEQVWRSPHGLAPLGFHLRHIAGSVDRLTTYLEGCQLDEAQLAALRAETEPGASLADLLDGIDRALDRAARVIRSIDAATFPEPRYVGRRRLPTTVLGVIVHIAEHTQRHLGQAISAAKLVRVA